MSGTRLFMQTWSQFKQKLNQHKTLCNMLYLQRKTEQLFSGPDPFIYDLRPWNDLHSWSLKLLCFGRRFLIDNFSFEHLNIFTKDTKYNKLFQNKSNKIFFALKMGRRWKEFWKIYSINWTLNKPTRLFLNIDNWLKCIYIKKTIEDEVIHWLIYFFWFPVLVMYIL